MNTWVYMSFEVVAGLRTLFKLRLQLAGILGIGSWIMSLFKGVFIHDDCTWSCRSLELVECSFLINDGRRLHLAPVSNNSNAIFMCLQSDQKVAWTSLAVVHHVEFCEVFDFRISTHDSILLRDVFFLLVLVQDSKFIT